MSDFSEQELRDLGGSYFNKRVGNFLYTQREANPNWYYYVDDSGNCVFHGGRGCQTDVHIEIKGAFQDVLRPRLYAYMEELVGRHGEVLHEEGVKQFHGVTIELPYRTMGSNRITIHTGSGCCYDQDEIAYEVMAALSGLSFYKALAPRYVYHKFLRVDVVTDDDHPVTFFNESSDILVFFSHKKDGSYVTVLGPRNEVFEKVMFAYFAAMVEGRRELGHASFVRDFGDRHYTAHSESDSVDVSIKPELDGKKVSFGIKLPYNLSFQSFPRLHFAKGVMEMLSEDLIKVEEVISL